MHTIGKVIVSQRENLSNYYVTLGLWCGLRPTAEIQRLQWEDIHLDEDNPSVYIHPDWKVKHGRWVDIPPCAVSLLRICKKPKGHVVNPKNLRRRLDWLKEDASGKRFMVT